MNELMSLLLVATIALPLILALSCTNRRILARASGLLMIAPLPGLAAALIALTSQLGGIERGAIVIDAHRLQLTLLLDAPRAVLLGASALLWCLAGAYARRSLRTDPHRGRFSIAWLLSLSGCLGVFVAGDLALFYLLYAVASLSAVVLVMHDGTPKARRAALIYLFLAVAGEAVLLLAFVLLAFGAPGESLRISTVVAALSDSPLRVQTIAFLFVGFGLKAGLVPLHGWLPLAHPAAPTPASAVLSGSIIKTGIIGLMIFLPFGHAVDAWRVALIVAGATTALYAVLIGITQHNPKTILAYSSVSQMGVIVALLGAGLTDPSSDHGVLLVASFYAAHHALVKGALFLAVGVVATTSMARRRVVLAAASVLALSLAGLPFTSGMLAKLAAKPYFQSDLLSLFSIISSAGSALLMLHFVRRLAQMPEPASLVRSSIGMAWPLWALAGASIIVPWTLWISTLGASPWTPLQLSALVASAWPIAVGAAAVLLLRRITALLPVIPEGDLIVLGERAARACGKRGRLLDPVNRALCQWATAGIAVLALVLLFSGLLWSSTRSIEGTHPPAASPAP